jgi:hypothetical protein
MNNVTDDAAGRVVDVVSESTDCAYESADYNAHVIFVIYNYKK